MPTTLAAEAAGLEEELERIRRDDALGQLLGRQGRMAELGSEDGEVKLGWADQLAWALEHPEVLGGVEELAADLAAEADHLVWSGMGGSVQAVHTLGGLGLLPRRPAVHTLDSTDPAALNHLLRALAATGGLDAALRRTVMAGVSMGMTSEEPITHLRWFEGLLRERGAGDTGAHVLVMTLPGSFLDRFARRRGARRVELQPDGLSTMAGRMSAPTTRVFLVPAALALGGRGLAGVLERCQAEYRLRPGLDRGERDRVAAEDPFVRLAAWLSAQAGEGRDMVLLDLPLRWRGLGPWIEQVVEESLGKGGRGLLVFPGQDLAAAARWPDRFSVLRVDEGEGVDVPGRPLAVLSLGDPEDAAGRLAVTARVFAGWNLTVAMVGWLQGITFAGQPAVEGYKRYARELRRRPGRLPYPGDSPAAGGSRLALFHGDLPEAESPGGRDHAGASGVLAGVLESRLRAGRLGYFDLTLNAAPEGPLWERAAAAGLRFANHTLRRPAKVRSGPRDYHSTEQSETDGPPDLLSLRVLVRATERVAAGRYSARFLHAQALGTRLAMRDAGRPVLLATLEGPEDVALLEELLEQAGEWLGATAAR